MMTVQERCELNKFLVENEEWLYSKAGSLVYSFDDVFKTSLDGRKDSAYTLAHDTYIEAVTSCCRVQERYPSFHPFLVGIMKRLIYQRKSAMKLQSNRIVDSIPRPLVDEELFPDSSAPVDTTKQVVDINHIDFLVNIECGDVEENVARRDCLERLLANLAKLDERDCDLFRLRYGANLSVERIAEIFQLSPENVRVRISRITKRLKKFLEKDKGA